MNPFEQKYEIPLQLYYFNQSNSQVLVYFKRFVEEETIAAANSMNQKQINILQRQLIVTQLQVIIQNTPAFQKYSDIIKVLNQDNAIELLRGFPLMSKHDILINPEKYHRIDLDDEKKYDVRTGGTSGEILSFTRIKSEYDVEKRHISYCWKLIDILLGEDRGVILTGRPAKHSIDGFSFIDRNKMLWLACNEPSDSHWKRIYEAIIDYSPKYIRGYGSLVSEFFKRIYSLKLGPPPSLQSVTYSSDPMLPNELEFIRKNYCDNLISLYGQTERVTMGVTCKKGNKFHLLPTYGFTEIVRDDGSVIDQPGEIGEIVSTSLYTRSCSFVRYLTGDLGSWSEEKCECGFVGQAIDQFVQRSHEKVINKFGDEINIGRRNSFLNMRDSLPEGVGVQFVQRESGNLHVYIQTTNREPILYERALNYLETEFQITYEFIDHPILNENGKRTLLVFN